MLSILLDIPVPRYDAIHIVQWVGLAAGGTLIVFAVVFLAIHLVRPK